MTTADFQREWMKLSEQLGDALDDRRKASKIRKQMDKLWAKLRYVKD